MKEHRKEAIGASLGRVVCTSNRHSSKKQRTPLFEAILELAWSDIRRYVQNGKWHNRQNDYGDSHWTPEQQAKHWESYRDTYSHERLRQLPLHAAISHLAPLSIVKLLIKLYPGAVRHPDNQGNLPLHIAFITNARDVSSYLLKVFPEAIMESNFKGELPVLCADRLYRTVSENTNPPLIPGLSSFALSSQSSSEQDTKSERDMRRLEQQLKRDERVMRKAQSELSTIKEGLRRIRSVGRQKISTYVEQEHKLEAEILFRDHKKIHSSFLS